MIEVASAVALICLMIAFFAPKTVILWVVFAVSAASALCGILFKKFYNQKISAMPEEYAPVIGSPNKELIEYAERWDMSVPTAEEAMSAIKAKKEKADMNSKDDRTDR